MSEYKKKKQLLDENKDMYISEYDKNLSYDALSRIVSAKKDYAEAAKANNKAEMTKANDIANAVRAKYGSYTGGEFGDEYHPFSYHEDDFEDYESRYEDELDRLYKLVTNGEKDFAYNYEDDPVYKAYKKVYETQGNLAYDRALAQNSLKTGGVENTHAQSAAMQALGYYNSQLAAKIPELYEAAYDRYYTDRENNYKRLKDSYDIIKNRESRDYDRYLDRIENRKDNRDFVYRQKSDIMDNIFKREEREAEALANLEEKAADYDYKLKQSQLDDEANSRELMYEILRDAIEDEKWRSEYNLDAYKQSYPAYRGSIGTGDVLSYARKIFQNNSLTMQDLYNLLGL